MQKCKGITLVSLVITITVLLILVSVATYSGLNVISSSKLTAFTAELKIMQTQVNAIYEEDKEQQIGIGLTEDSSVAAQATKVFTANESGITSSEGYRYWSKDEVKKLGIEGVEQDFFINIQTRSVVSYEGLKYQGKTYYTLEQLPDGLYNVKYEPTPEEKPTFQISFECMGANQWRVNISDIQYNGYIDKWQVAYQLEGDTNWNISENVSFTVEKAGKYRIKIQNGDVKSKIKSEEIGHRYIEGVCEICNRDVRYITLEEGQENWNFSIISNYASGFGMADSSGIWNHTGKKGNTINASCWANNSPQVTLPDDYNTNPENKKKGNVGMIIYNQPIDVTNISKIVMDCWLYSNATTATNYTTMGISNSNSQTNFNDFYSFTQSKQVSNYGENGAQKYRLELDLSDYTGSYYLKITTLHDYERCL